MFIGAIVDICGKALCNTNMGTWYDPVCSMIPPYIESLIPITYKAIEAPYQTELHLLVIEMDPLSLTASIIAVLGASATVASGIEKIISMRNAPDAILALNNEVADFQLVVGMIHELLQDYNSSNSTESAVYTESLTSVLVRAKQKLLELDMLIQYRLMTGGTKQDFNRIAWVREHRKVKALQDEIRSIRMNLVAVIGVLTSRAAFRIELQVSGLRRISNELQSQFHRNEVMIDQAVKNQNRALSPLPSLLETQERTEVQIDKLLSAYATSRGVGSSCLERSSTPRDSSITLPDKDKICLQTISMRKRFGSQCHSRCACRCHQRSTWTSSPSWQSYLGLLFIGYTGLPTISCNDIRCEQNSNMFVGFKYYFPWWFSARMLDISVQISKPYSLTQSFRAYRIVWDNSQLFNAARSGDLPILKAVLSSREGSPYDIDEISGETALSLSKD